MRGCGALAPAITISSQCAARRAYNARTALRTLQLPKRKALLQDEVYRSVRDRVQHFKKDINNGFVRGARPTVAVRDRCSLCCGSHLAPSHTCPCACS